MGEKNPQNANLFYYIKALGVLVVAGWMWGGVSEVQMNGQPWPPLHLNGLQRAL